MRIRLLLPVVLLVTAGAMPLASAGAAPCTSAGPAGGDWPAYGGPRLGQNNQINEKRLSPSTVGQLKLAWQSESTAFQSMPVTSGRCVYFTDNGKVEAHDVTTGRLVWKTPAPLPWTQYAPFAVAVSEGRVLVNFDNKLAPRQAALDANSGDVLWQSPAVRFDYPAWQLSSPAVAGGVSLFTTTGPDFDPHARPGFAVLDSRTGRVLSKRTTIPVKDLARGFAGGGIWGTPVIDPVGRYAYAGTSNPYSKSKEHAYDNAMIKIDVDPRRRTFGQVVASYKGIVDNVVGDPVYNTPVCQQAGDVGPTFPFGSAGCQQHDIDFGNSPTLWYDAKSRLMVTQLQKLGTLHTVRASDMALMWKANLGTDSLLTLTGGNHGNAATDGRSLFLMTNPGVLQAIEAATGRILWATPLAEPIASKNVVFANGVVYATDYAGLHAFDAATGVRLWDSVRTGTTTNCGAEGDMLSLAHGTLFANCGGTIFAFRP